MDTKLCKKCGQTKPLTDFHSNKSKPDRRQIYCKPCMCAMVKTYTHRNRTAD